MRDQVIGINDGAMIGTIAQQLLLGSAKLGPLASVNPAAWTALADRGLVTISPAGGDPNPAVIVTITEAGRAAQLAAAE